MPSHPSLLCASTIHVPITYGCDSKSRYAVFIELSIESLYGVIDSAVSLIGDAQERNFQRWPILNQYVWPNAFVGGDYLSEINYLKSWISDRIQWMDQQFLELKDDIDLPVSYTLKDPYPNPFNPTTNLEYMLSEDEVVDISIYDRF